jgi:hypothetical protein
MRITPATAAISLLAPIAAAQSFNINIGPSGGPTPSSGYAAAGQAGVWMTLPAFHNTTTFNLVDRAGTTTGVSVWQYGGTQLRATDDPATLGDDDALMDECQVTFTPSLETCLFFNGLENGDYEVLIYACMPAQPTVLSYTSCDEEPGRPHRTVGGAWPGQHQEFVTYSRHSATVTSGLLRTHSGIVPGQPAANGAALNGIQLRRIIPSPPGDVDGDGDVDLGDLTTLLSAFGLCTGDPAYVAACDLDATGCVELGDLTILLANFGL